MVLLLALCVPPPVSLVPSTLWSLCLHHDIGIPQKQYGVFFDYFNLIPHMVLFLIASDCFSVDGFRPGVW